MASKQLFDDFLYSNQLSACMDIHRLKWQEFKWRIFSSLALLHCIGIDVIPPGSNCAFDGWACDKELVLGHLRAFTQSQDKKISFISSRRGRRVSKFDRWSVSIYLDYTPTSIHRWTWNVSFFAIRVKEEEPWGWRLCFCVDVTIKR